jgi:hypothetical protein
MTPHVVGHLARVLGLAVLCGAMPVVAGAQRTDTTRAPVDTAGPAPELRPPLTPRRAFLYSLVMPGYAQSVLGRNRTSSLIMAFETVALVMIRESAGSLREARRNLADSVIVSYVDASGQPRLVYQRTPFSAALVRSRQEQLEDWIAVLVGNHLFAGADAYVAALLWDLPAEVAFRATPRSTRLALRLYW